MNDNIIPAYEERFKNYEKDIESLTLLETENSKRIDRLENNYTRLETTFEIYTKLQKEQIEEIKIDQRQNYEKLDKKMDNVIELMSKNSGKKDNFEKFGFDFFKDLLKTAILVAIILGVMHGLNIF